MSEVKPFNTITEAQVQDWKAKYPNKVREISIPVDDTEAKFWVKKPNRATIEFLANEGAKEKKDVAKINKVLIANCVLGGDMDEIENDAQVYLGVVEQLSAMLGKRQNELKN